MNINPSVAMAFLKPFWYSILRQLRTPRSERPSWLAGALPTLGRLAAALRRTACQRLECGQRSHGFCHGAAQAVRLPDARPNPRHFRDFITGPALLAPASAAPGKWRLRSTVLLLLLANPVVPAERNSGVLVGDLGCKEALVFEGNKAFTTEQIWFGLGMQLDFHVAAHPAAPLVDYVQMLQRMVRAGYQREGFAEARVAVQHDARAESIRVKVEEGVCYHCGNIQFTTPTNVSLTPLHQRIAGSLAGVTSAGRMMNDALVCWSKDFPAPCDEAARQNLAAQVGEVLADLGYFNPRFTVRVVPDPARHRADLHIDIVDAGLRGVISEIEVRGHRKISREDVLKFLDLKPGTELRHQRLRQIEDQLFRSARFLKHEAIVEPLAQPGRFKLIIELVELAGAPALTEDLTVEQKVFLKVGEWWENWDRHLENLVVDYTWEGGEGTMSGQVVLSGNGTSLLVWSSASNQPPALRYGAVLSSEVMGLYSLVRAKKLVAPPGQFQLRLLLSIVPNAAPRARTPFDASFGLGFGTRHSEPPFLVKMTYPPVAALHNASPKSAFELRDGILAGSFASEPDIDGASMVGSFSFDAATGRLLHLRMGGTSPGSLPLWIEMRTETGAFEKAIREIATATANLPNVYSPDKPFSTALAFLAADLLHSPLPPWILSNLPVPYPWERSLAMLQRLDLQPLFVPAELLSGNLSTPQEKLFRVPPTGPFVNPMSSGSERLPPALPVPRFLDPETVRMVAAYFLLNSDSLWPRGSWPWTLLREAMFTVTALNRYTTNEIRRVVASNRTGPMGCLALGRWAVAAHPELSSWCATQALARLSPVNLQKDLHLLLDYDTIVSRMATNLVSMLSALGDEDLAAMLAPVNSDVAAFLGHCARQVRAVKAQPLSNVLAPVVLQHWEKFLRPSLVAALARTLINLGVLHYDQGKLPASEDVIRQALAIQCTSLSPEHPEIVTLFRYFSALLVEQGKFAEVEREDRKVAFARWGIGMREFSAARFSEYIALLTRAIENTPPPGIDGLDGLTARAHLFGRQGQWQAAADDYTHVLKLKPSLPFFVLVPLTAETDEIAGLASHRRRLWMNFGQSKDPETAAETAIGLVIHPAESFLLAASELSELAVMRGTNHVRYSCFQLAKALAEYRQKQFASAADWAGKSLVGSGTNFTTAVAAGAVLAMAQHQLEQTDEARKGLAQASESFQTKLPKLESGDLGEHWPEWLIARILLREAKGLIGNQ